MSVLLLAVAAATLPIHAGQKFKSRATSNSTAPTRVAIKLPDFVPIVNYDQFLLASRNEDFVGRDGISTEVRTAAEALSAKFAGPRTGSGNALFRAVVQNDPIAPSLLDAPEDPKLGMQVAAISNSDDADPEKAASSVAPSTTHKATASNTVVRRHVRGPRRTVLSRHRTAKRTVVRRTRNRVASAEPAQRSGPVYNGIGADLERLVGFGTLTQDSRLTN
ncbi:hypothetical protein [Hyphomicrobium sp.]|uniref:hypothetical protein n=1 Tax=Hyphomicrobium sp. TaxID=82 RepID=UPI002CBBEA4D|nr:hypothetical protein [Hyphomicrobium sp.]HVZ03485.1 hypothetical protein [Hyphomicrobium sp.]